MNRWIRKICSKIVVVLVSLNSSSALACAELVSPPSSVVESGHEVDGTPYIIIRDKKNPKFYVAGAIKNKELIIEAYLTDGLARSELRSGIVGRRIINHFSGQFCAIRDVWDSGANLAQVNQQVGEARRFGLTTNLEAAIRSTISFRAFSQIGYARIEVIEATQNEQGFYSFIDVRFKKPWTMLGILTNTLCR